MPQALRQGLVLCCSFDRDEEGRITDGSAKKNDGSARGGTWVREAKVGGGYRCGATSGHIDVGARESLRLTQTDFSIAAWIKLDGYNYIGNGIVGSAPWASPGRGYFFRVEGTENGSPGRLSGSFYTADGSSYIRSTGTPIDMGSWHHVAWTWSAKVGHRLYVDGQPVEDTETRGGLAEMADYAPSVWLGVEWRERGSYNRGLNGVLDEVMIFERALSAAEIKAVHDTQKGAR